MPARLNPLPLVGGLLNGLKERRQIGVEPVDRWARFFLYGVPITAAIASWVVGVKLQAAEQLIAGFALFVGALLATFAQLAGWRERLTSRGKKVDGVKMRAIDEAVAHVLLGAITSAFAVACLLVISSEPYSWLNVALSGLAVAVMVNILVTLMIVTNLLWDGYRAANPVAPPVTNYSDRNSDAEVQRRDDPA